MIASKKELAVLLSKLQPFEYPDPSLEQYPTDSEIAAALLWEAHMQGEITDKNVSDFGCGTGILGIGALVLGAKHVNFVEIDPRIFPTLLENLALLEQVTGTPYSNYEIVEGNIIECCSETDKTARCNCEADIIVQNPPFGTKNKGIDVCFLKKSIEFAPIVYSLHKHSTEAYLRRVVQTQGGNVAAAWNFKFPLKMTMKQHAKKIQYIDVVCLKITRPR